MLRLLLLACIVSGALGYRLYPHSSHTLLDPGTYNLLKSTDTGPFNETWGFNKVLRLTALIVPSQVIDLGGTGSYDESITVRVFKYKWSPPNMTELAGGEFRGTVSYREAIYIPIRTIVGNEPPVMGMVNDNPGEEFRMEFTFNRKGFYPWYTTSRLFSTTGAVHKVADGPGYCIGLEYSLS